MLQTKRGRLTSLKEPSGVRAQGELVDLVQVKDRVGLGDLGHIRGKISIPTRCSIMKVSFKSVMTSLGQLKETGRKNKRASS